MRARAGKAIVWGAWVGSWAFAGYALGTGVRLWF